jgi:hypothetical protein
MEVFYLVFGGSGERERAKPIVKLRMKLPGEVEGEGKGDGKRRGIKARARVP